MIHPELSTYLATLADFSASELAEIGRDLIVEEFPKGAQLLAEGEVSRACYFVLKGCVRKYQLIDGTERTLEFYTEYQPVVSVTSYMQEIPADHGYTCLEDCVLMVGTKETEAAMYGKYPKLEAMTRAFTAQVLGETQQQFAAFMTSNPEARYLRLLEDRPNLVQRVPQQQIASYLGVAPESLSRIKRRVAHGKDR
ncbi:Crp/Fnr family transcriptional regulator [Pontibacter sp. G13]|uniref:Crp/Fnr family transcriptional regulator n=1 Tax=Pontibacter sp. G13 TaxID=3074898 RepID=UPI00288BAE92|nr:Crp/Fnr family transcriptional regulator [Pontibacter sp. G13]WNJ19155.1 Crp/Fnr family transcriptional regulator [Pontibacter sp. G13]